MIDDAVLAALARALAGDGDLEAALAALRRGDPLLRGAAGRRLREAHADALLATQVRQGREGARHALRLAYLLVLRALPPAQSATTRPPSRPRTRRRAPLAPLPAAPRGGRPGS